MTRNKITVALGLSLGIFAFAVGAILTWGGGSRQPSSPAAAAQSLAPSAPAAPSPAPSTPAAHHHARSAPAPSGHRVTSPRHQPQPVARVVAHSGSGHQTFRTWWRDTGRSQYEHVGTDLWKVIMIDVVNDKDATYTADLGKLVADTRTARGNPPSEGRADYVAAMGDFHRAGQIAQRNGSYVRAYALIRTGLRKLNSFSAAAGLATSAS